MKALFEDIRTITGGLHSGWSPAALCTLIRYCCANTESSNLCNLISLQWRNNFYLHRHDAAKEQRNGLERFFGTLKDTTRLMVFLK